MLQIVKFETAHEKEKFINKLEEFLGKVGVGRHRLEINVAQMLKSAVTKADRQIQLEKFFRVVFSQVINFKPLTLF